jgi:acetyltransferase-like isoleucine patch superfamily enzyme
MSDSNHVSQSPQIPANVRLGYGSTIMGEYAFKRFHSKLDPGLQVGEHSTMDGVHFAIGAEGRVKIGNFCYLTNVVLLCEIELQLGNYIMIGWNSTIADTDFHPIEPAQRIADAIACSPLGGGRPRPHIPRLPVVIEDEVWVGPNVTILKGVRIGRGAWIEPGSLVVRDVPPGMRVMGNPAQTIGKAE